MMRRPNLRRVLLVFVPALLLVIIIHNLVLINFHKKDNLVSLLLVRRNNLTGDLRAEIYPIALLYRGKYYDAGIDASDYVNVKSRKESYLSFFKDLFVVDRGKKLGLFHVDEVTTSPLMCSSILTGKGHFKGGSDLSDVFSGISDSRSSHAKGVSGATNFDYTLKWTLAVSKLQDLKEADIVPAAADGKRYREDIIKIGQPLLSYYGSDSGNKAGDKVILEDLSYFDLDHDGRPEVWAKLKKQIKRKTTGYEGPKEQEEDSNDTVYLSLWVTYKSGSPQVVSSLISYEPEGSWGKGYDLVGALDLDGDGIDEVIMRKSRWEVVQFEIYEYRKDKLERVFRGAGFGC